VIAPQPDRLGNVYWLGGGSGAGKSTIARRLAGEFGMALHDTDASMADHAARSNAAAAPLLDRFKRMSMDERWLLRSPAEMLASFHWFEGEAFDLIIEDLLAMPRSRPVLVEGLRLLPHLVLPHLPHRRQALWLLPTPRFRTEAFAARDGLWDIAGRTSRPQAALANLLERDALFTDRLAREVAALGLPHLAVDGRYGEDGMVALVAAMMGLR